MSSEFKCTLLRERFVLRDPAGELSDTPPVIALSNRIVLSLTSKYGEETETFIIRTQNMHTCTRLAASLAKEYYDRGAIMKRIMPFRFEHTWHDIIKGYEKDWNPDVWAAVYFKGRAVFEHGTHHAFLDIIEKCDAVNREDYAESVKFAESAFQQAGKAMKIDHDSNIALIVTIKDDEARCGVIVRGAQKKTTFNFTVKQKPKSDLIRIPTILTVCAGFLEGVQLAFHIGVINRKRTAELVPRYSDEDRKGKRGAERLLNLANAIDGIELKYTVHYRPEKPDFQQMVREADEFAVTLIRPLIEARKKASASDNPDEWVV